MLRRMRLAFALLGLVAASFGQDAQTLFNNALAAQQSGDLAVAIENYQAVLKRQPNLVPALLNLGAAEIQVGRTDDGLAHYRTAFEHARGNAKVAVLFANALVSAHRYDQAVELLAPLIKTNPANLDAQFVLGEALRDSGKPGEALPHFQRIADERKDADGWLMVASTQIKLGQYREAITNARKSTELNPKLPDAFDALGLASAYASDYDGAKAAYRQALTLDPNDFEANVRLGTLLVRIDQDPASAKPLLANALAADPFSSAALFEMARVLASEHRDEEAITALERIIHRNPSLVEPHVQLAALYARAKRRDDSLRERQIVDQLNADFQKTGKRPASLEEGFRPTTEAP